MDFESRRGPYKGTARAGGAEVALLSTEISQKVQADLGLVWNGRDPLENMKCASAVPHDYESRLVPNILICTRPLAPADRGPRSLTMGPAAAAEGPGALVHICTCRPVPLPWFRPWISLFLWLCTIILLTPQLCPVFVTTAPLTLPSPSPYRIPPPLLNVIPVGNPWGFGPRGVK